jgi:hypothetical protein
MVFNATLSIISVISWRSVLSVEETEVPGGNYWPVRSHWQTLSYNIVSSTPRHEQGTDCAMLSYYLGSIDKRPIYGSPKKLKHPM